MDTKYELYIYGGETGVTISSKKGDHGNYIIKKLSYSKGLYSPNSVEIDISVSGVSQTDIRTTFESKSADLKVYAKENSVNITHQICQDYIVYQLRIVSEASTKTVHLTLFSRDKLLTLDKFSRVYLNQRLGLNIIEDSLKKGGFLADCKVGVLQGKDNKLAINRLQFLYYTPEGKASNSFEAIQPYRVQYNEDFYQFISRVACQCGEMLFFEDGKLTLGPDPTDTVPVPIKDDDIYRIEYPAVENSQLKVNDYHRNFFNGKDAVLKDKNVLQYSDCTAFDEYYDIYDSESLPNTLKKEFYWPDVADLVLKTTIPAIGIACASGDALTTTEKLLKTAKEGAAIAGRYAANIKYVNDQYNENVFNKASKKTNNYSEAQQKNNKKLCQFADVFPAGQLKHDRLAEIRKMEMTAAKQTITVQIKTSSFTGLKLKLGNRVQLVGNPMVVQSEDSIYVVTACRGDFLKSGSDEMDITEIEIVPLQNGIFVPPYNKCAEYTPVQPQTAIVADASDPRLLGRVRIRYPWQLEGAGSPWVRVLTPFSTANGDCIHFQPHVDDEVMLGYVGGNIERPYVIGSLFGKDEMSIHDNLYLTNNNTIKVGSQRLDFREGSMSAFLASFVPAWGFASQFAPGTALNMKTDHSSGWHGMTRLTDVNSFWKIEGNTATRAVTIDSAWGKVSISAYTGIDIEAVGDVTIKGNNINIKAQNNVTIESGIALKNARKSWDSKGGTIAAEAATDFLADFVNLDLSFLRTIWESIVPPKEGTLKIKSNRYLLLEAGKDGTALDNELSQGTKNHKMFAPEDPSQVGKTVSDLDKIYCAVGLYADSMKQKNVNVALAAHQLDDIINSLKEKLANENLQNVGEIILELKTKSVEQLTDFRTMDTLVVYGGNNEYEQGKTPYQWIITAMSLKSFLDAHNNAFEKIALKKNLKSINEIIVNKFSEFINGENNHIISATEKNQVYQTACEQYFSTVNNNFQLGNQNTWEDKVNHLTCRELKDTSFFKNLFSNTLDSLRTGSDYDFKVYKETQAMNLPAGKIIMSSTKEHSLVVKDSNVAGAATGSLEQTLNDISLEGVKSALKKGFIDENIPQIDENILHIGGELPFD